MTFFTDHQISRAMSAVLLVAPIVLLSACDSSKEVAMTPDEARDALVTTVEDSATQLGYVGWSRSHAPEVGNCGSRQGERTNYSYAYGAPAPDSDRAADARRMAEYWQSLGMQVRVVESPDYVVYATGGPVEGLSFSTAPGDYYIAGTSLCVSGDAEEIRKRQAD